MRGPILANLSQLGALLAGLTLALVALHRLERAASRYVAHRLGWRAVLLTGWIGVPVHEVSHLIAAHIFGHRIIAWKLFDPDPATGTLGYVRHARARHTLWQRLGDLAIGLSPPLVGGALLTLLLSWMVPARELRQLVLPLADSASVAATLRALGQVAVDLVAAVWAHRSAWLPLQLYLGVCVAAHLAPSAADLRATLPVALTSALCAGGLATGAAALGWSLAPALVLLPLLALLQLVVAMFWALYLGVVALISRRQGARVVNIAG